MHIDNIDLFGGLNMNPIPLEFSQSLTTTEWLGAMQSKINQIIDLLNQHDSNAEKYTNEQIAIIKNYIDDINRELTSAVATGKLDCINHSDKNKEYAINEMSKTLADCKSELIAKIEGDDNVIIADVNKKYEYLLSIIRKYSIEIVNPTTGQYSTIQDTLNDIYNMLRNDAMKIEEFEALEFTAEEFDALNITCQQYDMYAKQFVTK